MKIRYDNEHVTTSFHWFIDKVSYLYIKEDRYLRVGAPAPIAEQYPLATPDQIHRLILSIWDANVIDIIDFGKREIS
jgi:hypothetical protein